MKQIQFEETEGKASQGWGGKIWRQMGACHDRVRNPALPGENQKRAMKTRNWKSRMFVLSFQQTALNIQQMLGGSVYIPLLVSRVSVDRCCKQTQTNMVQCCDAPRAEGRNTFISYSNYICTFKASCLYSWKGGWLVGLIPFQMRKKNICPFFFF